MYNNFFFFCGIFSCNFLIATFFPVTFFRAPLSLRLLYMMSGTLFLKTTSGHPKDVIRRATGEGNGGGNMLGPVNKAGITF